MFSTPKEGEERRSGESPFHHGDETGKPAPKARARTRFERVRSAVSALHAAIFGRAPWLAESCTQPGLNRWFDLSLASCSQADGSRSVPLGGAAPNSRSPAPSEVREKPQSYSAIWNAFRRAPPQMNRNASKLTFWL
jgi:hypothetical protein